MWKIKDVCDDSEINRHYNNSLFIYFEAEMSHATTHACHAWIIRFVIFSMK